MPPHSGQQPEWIRAGEELVRRVQNLVDHHGVALEQALTQSLGSNDEARDEIRQLDMLARVLALEMWRKRVPDRRLGAHFAAAVGFVLGTAGGQIVDLVAADLYAAIKGAETQAETVVQHCEVEIDLMTVEQRPLDGTEGFSEPVDRSTATSEPTVIPVGQAVEHDEAGQTALRPRSGIGGGLSQPFHSVAGRASINDSSMAETDARSMGDEQVTLRTGTAPDPDELPKENHRESVVDRRAHDPYAPAPRLPRDEPSPARDR